MSAATTTGGAPATTAVLAGTLDTQRKQHRRRVSPWAAVGLGVGYLVLVLFTFVYIYPFIIQLVTGFKTDPDAAQNSLPVALVFFAFRRYFISGANAGAEKG